MPSDSKVWEAVVISHSGVRQKSQVKLVRGKLELSVAGTKKSEHFDLQRISTQVKDKNCIEVTPEDSKEFDIRFYDEIDAKHFARYYSKALQYASAKKMLTMIEDPFFDNVVTRDKGYSAATLPKSPRSKALKKFRARANSVTFGNRMIKIARQKRKARAAAVAAAAAAANVSAQTTEDQEEEKNGKMNGDDKSSFPKEEKKDTIVPSDEIATVTENALNPLTIPEDSIGAEGNISPVSLSKTSIQLDSTPLASDNEIKTTVKEKSPQIKRSEEVKPSFKLLEEKKLEVQLSVTVTAYKLNQPVKEQLKNVTAIVSLNDPDGDPKCEAWRTYEMNGSSPIMWDNCTFNRWQRKPYPGDYILFFISHGSKKVLKGLLKLGRDVKSSSPFSRWLPLVDADNPQWENQSKKRIGELYVKVDFRSSDPFAFRHYKHGPKVRFKLSDPAAKESRDYARCCFTF